VLPTKVVGNSATALPESGTVLGGVVQASRLAISNAKINLLLGKLTIG
jgi:hypothetical protein